jgi:hypothetical protein
MKPQMNAMTLSGLVIVMVSIVVVGAIAEGDGCRMLICMKGKLDLKSSIITPAWYLLTSYIKNCEM